MARGPWSEAALDRAGRAVADWAMRAEPPDRDPERTGQWRNRTADPRGEEKARRIARTLEDARGDFWVQRVYDLADARRHPLAVVERALRLLR